MVKLAFKRNVNKLISILCSIGGSISGILLLIVSFLILYSVFMRYVIGQPSAWINEVVSFLLVPVVALALGDTQANQGHVSVDLLVIHLPRGAKNVLRRSVYILMTAYVFFAIWATSIQALESWSDGVRSIIGRIPLFAVQILIPIGFAVLVLQTIADCFAKPTEKNGGPHPRDEKPHESSPNN